MSGSIDLYTIPIRLRRITVESNGRLLAALGVPLKGFKPAEEREEPEAIVAEDYARKPLDREDCDALKGSEAMDSGSLALQVAAAGGVMDKHKACRDALIASAGRTALLESAINLLYSRASICQRNMEG